MAGQRIHIVMNPELLERVDRAKAMGESRGEFVRRALEQALGDAPPKVGDGNGPRPPAPARAPRPVTQQQRYAMERQRKLNEGKS